MFRCRSRWEKGLSSRAVLAGAAAASGREKVEDVADAKVAGAAADHEDKEAGEKAVTGAVVEGTKAEAEGILAEEEEMAAAVAGMEVEEMLEGETVVPAMATNAARAKASRK